MAMDQKVLIRSVAERSMLSREESADITRAVLEGLAGQLGEGEAKRLTLDLPDPMTEQLRARAAAGTAHTRSRSPTSSGRWPSVPG